VCKNKPTCYMEEVSITYYTIYLITTFTMEDKIKAIYEEIANKGFIYSRLQKDYIEKDKPVMIWDVLDWRTKLNDSKSVYFDEKIVKLLALWDTKRLPIEKQSEECIDYIFNLKSNDRINGRWKIRNETRGYERSICRLNDVCWKQ